jgi:hypothetical protein
MIEKPEGERGKQIVLFLFQAVPEKIKREG